MNAARPPKAIVERRTGFQVCGTSHAESGTSIVIEMISFAAGIVVSPAAIAIPDQRRHASSSRGVVGAPARAASRRQTAAPPVAKISAAAGTASSNVRS